MEDKAGPIAERARGTSMELVGLKWCHFQSFFCCAGARWDLFFTRGVTSELPICTLGPLARVSCPFMKLEPTSSHEGAVGSFQCHFTQRQGDCRPAGREQLGPAQRHSWGRPALLLVLVANGRGRDGFSVTPWEGGGRHGIAILDLGPVAHPSR